MIGDIAGIFTRGVCHFFTAQIFKVIMVSQKICQEEKGDILVLGPGATNPIVTPPSLYVLKYTSKWNAWNIRKTRSKI